MTGSIKEVDIFVVGCGPGGAGAAKAAAENGYSTLVVEKKDLSNGGRYKACGGALAWDTVDGTHFPEERIDRIIEGLELHHVDGEQYTKTGKGAVVWRSTFDLYLMELARDAGADVKDREPLIQIRGLESFSKTNGETMYEIHTQNNVYHAKYVISADGMPSRTLRLLNWPDFAKDDVILSITNEMRTSKAAINETLGSDKIHLFFGIKNLIPVGYAWLFPKAEHITTGWGNLRNLITNSRIEYQKFLDLPMVKQALNGAVSDIYMAHLIPVGIRSQLYQDQVFAVGDAGGIVDPISGKGIPYAMKSGEIAIKSIIECEADGDLSNMGEIYENQLERKFLKSLKAKRAARDRIFKNDETLKRFLGLWEKYSSSELIERGLI
ncbi:MAG: NAD(P)/FAD-dependent oxidoreductase [Candidatus Heimdallarchaeota archaeon]